ncbi:MAG: TIGR01777 family oxidoreductase [Microscillaceae bacterium]|jgi:hypothetical protein|nr:TIGR01777 family oxidoreductase [Microscillaceae bacterium]
MDSRKKIVIAGGSGFLGEAMAKYFLAKGYEVLIIARQNPQYSEKIQYAQWDGKTLSTWAKQLENATALINMAGKSVNCRYNEANKRQIYDSRLHTTRILGEAIGQCQNPPLVWLNSSSATIYRHALDRPMDEPKGEIGTGFSVDVCQQWEAEFNNASTPHTRKVILRTAIVLGKSGSVFPYLLHIVRLGWGGRQGNGKQMFSWIHLEDFNRAVHYLIDNEALSGVFNLSSPNPVSNQMLMQSLRQKGKFWLGLPAETWMVRLGAWLIGSEAELLLKSRWVLPTRLLESGFQFNYPNLDLALDELLT